jgi:hypothetical protein
MHIIDLNEGSGMETRDRLHSKHSSYVPLCLQRAPPAHINLYFATQFVIPAFSGTDIYKHSLCNIFTIATCFFYLPAPCPHTNLLSCTLQHASLTLTTLQKVTSVCTTHKFYILNFMVTCQSEFINK